MGGRGNINAKRPSVVDLFCGCGGLSLGARQAGFHSVISFDNDKNLTYSFDSNFPESTLRLADISSLSSRAILDLADGEIDGMVGGPPCQGFSSIGRHDKADPRRNLVVDFFRLVRGVNPKFFLMENVQGLEYAKNRAVLDEGLGLLPKRYKSIGPLKLDCGDFGAATRRPRIFIIGFDSERMDALWPGMFEGKAKPANVYDAIADVRDLAQCGSDKHGYDVWRLKDDVEVSQYAKALRGRSRTVTGHRKTAHAVEIVERFRNIQPGEKDPVGKHVRLSWTGQCPTLRAGTGSDRGSYQSVRPIHPSQARVITVREAARLQGFPDSFRFHPTVWHSFRMIGNSVSPIIAKALLSTIIKRLVASARLQAAE